MNFIFLIIVTRPEKTSRQKPFQGLATDPPPPPKKKKKKKKNF